MQMARSQSSPDATVDPQLAETFSVAQVSRLFEIPERRLRYWSQTGFLVPSLRRSGRLRYTFPDLIAIKVAKELLDAGLPLRRVRRSLDALRMSLPRDGTPLSKLRIRCDHDRVVVDDADHTFEASTGQLVLDFQVSGLSEQVENVLTMPWVSGEGQSEANRSAYEWFLHGCDLEQADEFAPAEVRDAYQRAVELDPELAAAWTNLGSLLVEQGAIDAARDSFAEALRCDPDQPEAQVNLAELALRDGDVEVAIAGYRQVLRTAPDYFEAHYGLARALLKVGGKGQAVAHLERFCRAIEMLPDSRRDASLQERWQSAHDVAARLRRQLARR